MPKAIGIGISAIFWEGIGIPTPLTYRSGEIGDVSPEEAMIRFTEDVNSPTSDFLSGVTIKINSVTEAFETGIRQTDNRYVLYGNVENFADANDVITFEYDDNFGDIEDDDGNPMGDISAQTIDNRVGMHLYYNNDEELIWLVIT